MSHIIYHPKRCVKEIGEFKIYHDNFKDNQDPYIWNKNFLHTYCHMPQMRNEVGDINFWVSANDYPNITNLFCDCVFVIEKKHYWTNADEIDIQDPIVDNNKQTFEHHFDWANKGSHPLKRKKRYTLIADSQKSFQPQDKEKNLIDILPFLNENGITTAKIIESMTSNYQSKPYRINNLLSQNLYDYLFETASIKIYGYQIENLHPLNKK